MKGNEMLNLPEFKAWLEGFSEAIAGAPTPDQWAKIKAKLATTQALTYPPVPYPIGHPGRVVVSNWPTQSIPFSGPIGTVKSC